MPSIGWCATGPEGRKGKVAGWVGLVRVWRGLGWKGHGMSLVGTSVYPVGYL